MIKKAFTLAEVLITLGIIGIVTAMTLPSLINRYEEKATVSKVKKIYSTLSQALSMSINEYGEVKYWNYSTSDSSTKETAEAFWNYLKPYFKIGRDCGTSNKCTYNGSVKLLNGNNFWDYNNKNNYYKIILGDGSFIWLRSNGKFCESESNGVDNICALVWYDTNGATQPNTFGKDVFIYLVSPDKVIPLPTTDCDCKYNGDGRGCADYIIKYEKMDYLREK